jgi:hypothetical protein
MGGNQPLDPEYDGLSERGAKILRNNLREIAVGFSIAMVSGAFVRYAPEIIVQVINPVLSTDISVQLVLISLAATCGIFFYGRTQRIKTKEMLKQHHSLILGTLNPRPAITVQGGTVIVEDDNLYNDLENVIQDMGAKFSLGNHQVREIVAETVKKVYGNSSKYMTDGGEEPDTLMMKRSEYEEVVGPELNNELNGEEIKTLLGLSLSATAGSKLLRKYSIVSGILAGVTGASIGALAGPMGAFIGGIVGVTSGYYSEMLVMKTRRKKTLERRKKTLEELYNYAGEGEASKGGSLEHTDEGNDEG